jgi:hypothetical protein
MSEIDEFISESQSEAEDEMGERFTIDGKSVAGITSEETESKDVQIAGFADNAQITFTVERKAISQALSRAGGITGAKVTRESDSKVFRVNGVVRNSATLIDLELIAENQA